MAAVRSVPTPARTKRNADLSNSASVREMAEQIPLWRLQGQAISDTDQAHIGEEFAHVIASISNGVLDHPKDTSPTSKPFKQVFWDDARHNPPLRNTHMCYEMDAQIKEGQRYWKKSGKKFSDEPRLAKIPMNDPNNEGPTKPEEFPNCFGKPSKVFDRTREVRPFSRARGYNKPIERDVSHVPLASKWANSVNPLTYRLPDPWAKFATNCSQIKSPTPQFRSGAKRFANDESPVRRHVQDKSLKNELAPTIDTRPYTPFPALDYMVGDGYTQEAAAADVYYEGIVQRGKATSLGGVLQPLFPAAPISEENTTSPNQPKSESKTGRGAKTPAGRDSSSSSSHTPASNDIVVSRDAQSRDAAAEMGSRRSMRTPKPIPVPTPYLPDSPKLFATNWDYGFSLSKSPLVSQWGKADDFDLKYRRIKETDGDCTIVPVTSEFPLEETLQEMPGAHVSKNWNQPDETFVGADPNMMLTKTYGPHSPMPRSGLSVIWAPGVENRESPTNSHIYSPGRSPAQSILTDPPIHLGGLSLGAQRPFSGSKFDDEVILVSEKTSQACSRPNTGEPVFDDNTSNGTNERALLHDPNWKVRAGSGSYSSAPHGLQTDSAFAKSVVDRWIPPTHYSSAPVLLSDSSVTRLAPNHNDPYEPPHFSAGLGVYTSPGLPEDDQGDLQLMPMNKTKSKALLQRELATVTRTAVAEGSSQGNKSNGSYNYNIQHNHTRQSRGKSRSGSRPRSQGEPQDHLVATTRRSKHGNHVNIEEASKLSMAVLQASASDSNKHYDYQIAENSAACNGDEDYSPVDHNFW